MSKTASPTSGVKVGDTVTYKVKVTNSGNVKVTNLTLEDDHGTPANFPTELAAGADTGDITYTYKVTQADVDAGQIVNTVKANATAVRGNNPAEVEAKATVTTVAADAKLTVTKTADKTSSVYLGDKVTYTVTVTNNGNVTITGIKMNDTLVTINEAAFDLAPGASKTITYEYTATQADIDAGKIENKATATGKDPKGKPVSAEGECTVGTAVPENPHLTVTKTTTSTTPEDGYKLGDTITYRITVTNDGNVTIDGISIEDKLEGFSFDAGQTTSGITLAPGQSASATGSYTVTEADIIVGSVRNEATANAGGNPPVEPGTKDVPTEEQKPGLSVTKSADKTSGVKQGETIKYTIVVTNTGNVTISGIDVSDTLVNFSGNNANNITLAPGATATITYSYKVTAADVEAGEVVNAATATGTAPDDKQYSDSDSVTVKTEEDEEEEDDDTPTPTPTPPAPAGPAGPAPGPAPAGPGVVPAAPDGNDGAVVPDNPVPEVEPEVDIDDNDTPLAEGTWAVINLIAAILTTLGAIVALFRKKEEEDEDEEDQNKDKAEDEDEDDNRGKKMLAAKIAGAVAGIASPIIFILTEDMSLPMALIDKWTLLMAVVLATQIAAAIFNKKASELDDEEEEEAEPAN